TLKYILRPAVQEEFQKILNRSSITALRRHRGRTPSVAVALMARRKQLSNCDPADPPTQLGEARDCLVGFGMAALRLRYEAGDRPAIAGDDDGFAPLHLVEDLRQMRLRFGCSHSFNQSI